MCQYIIKENSLEGIVLLYFQQKHQKHSKISETFTCRLKDSVFNIFHVIILYW